MHLQGLFAPFREDANRSKTNGLKAATHETKGWVSGQDSVTQPHAPLSALTHGPRDTQLSCPPPLPLTCPGRLRVMGKWQATCYLLHYWPFSLLVWGHYSDIQQLTGVSAPKD